MLSTGQVALGAQYLFLILFHPKLIMRSMGFCFPIRLRKSYSYKCEGDFKWAGQRNPFPCFLFQLCSSFHRAELCSGTLKQCSILESVQWKFCDWQLQNRKHESIIFLWKEGGQRQNPCAVNLAWVFLWLAPTSLFPLSRLKGAKCPLVQGTEVCFLEVKLRTSIPLRYLTHL